MKTCLFVRLAFGLSLLLLSAASRAQAPVLAPAALPGYWNLETNLTTRDYTIVRFYNAQDQLVYEERLPGLCLDLGQGRRRCRQATARHLNAALQQVLRDTAGRQPATLLARQFGPDRRLQRAYAVR